MGCCQRDPGEARVDHFREGVASVWRLAQSGRGMRGLTAWFSRGFSGLDGDFDARMSWMKGTEPVVAARCLQWKQRTSARVRNLETQVEEKGVD
jgi:hypothetical protein